MRGQHSTRTALAEAIVGIPVRRVSGADTGAPETIRTAREQVVLVCPFATWGGYERFREDLEAAAHDGRLANLAGFASALPTPFDENGAIDRPACGTALPCNRWSIRLPVRPEAAERRFRPQ